MMLIKSGTENKNKRNLELFQMLNWLIESEEVAKNNIRKSEEEVKSILNDRTHEETVSELTVSIYDTERNQKARQYKLDIVSLTNSALQFNRLFHFYLFFNSRKKDKKIAEEKLRKQTVEVDYLAPFLAEKGVGEKEPITQQIAIDLIQRCLNDLKQRLIDKANLIQQRFEHVTSFLNKLNVNLVHLK